MLHAEAAHSNTSLRSQNTVRGFPELRDERWSSASLRASLGEIETEPGDNIDNELEACDCEGDRRDTRRSQSVDLSLALSRKPTTPIIERGSVMMSKERDFSTGVLSDSAKSSRRKSWVSPLRLLERVRSMRSPGIGNGSPGRKYGW